MEGEAVLCETGTLGQQHKELSTSTREKAADLLEVVHSDICRPMQISTITGE